MAASVTQSQIRAVDPFASYNSNIVNRLTRIITRNRNSIHQQTDFDVTLNTLFPTTQLDISTGILFISDMFIEVQAPFTVDFLDVDFYEPSTIPMDSTGEYLLTIKYEYAISDPPPVGNVVILKPDQYALFKASGSPYLLYKVATVIDNLGTFEISSLADVHSTDPDIKRVYHELEERLISLEATLTAGSIPAVPNTLALRDSNADLYANDFYGDLVGSAATLTTPRQISLTGDVTGSVNFDGSQDVSILTEIINSQFNIVIDSTTGDFNTFEDYLAATPQDGDRVLINEDQTLSARINIPEGILIKLLKGKKFIIPKLYSDTQVVVFNDRSDSAGNLYFELRHIGAITTAVSFNGLDNHHENIILDNTGIGTIDDVFKIEADKIGNFAKGELLRTEPTLITNVLNDSSGSLANDIIIRERSYFIWNTRNSQFGTDSIFGIAHNGTDLWVAVGENGKLTTSPLGINWTQQISNFGSSTINAVASDGTSWIICGQIGKLAMSFDSNTWTLQDLSAIFGSDDIYDVIYDYTNSQWIAVGANATAARSNDGSSWVSITITGFSGSEGIKSIKYGNGLLIAAGDNGKLSTSTNGITWIQRTSQFGSTQIRGIGFDSINNLWIIVGDLGKAAISNDGINWTLQDVSSIFGVNMIYAIAYNGIDLWVAVANNGIIATCQNGIDWLRRFSNFTTSPIYNISFGIDKWVAVGDIGKLSTNKLISD